MAKMSYHGPLNTPRKPTLLRRPWKAIALASLILNLALAGIMLYRGVL